MDRLTTLAELRRSGLTLTADEAVAIVRKIIREHDDDWLAQPPFGPPAPDNVLIGEDGTVECRGCEVTPTPAEMAILLQALLADAPYMPGGLRYTMARAVHDVDAPPFDSIQEFSAALARFEPPDPDEAVRRVVARWIAARDDRGRDRRRGARSPDDLRRHLREADRQLYETQAGLAASSTDGQQRRTRGWFAAALLAGVMATVAFAAFGDARPPLPAPPPSPAMFAHGELVEPQASGSPFDGLRASGVTLSARRAHPKHPVGVARVRAPRERNHRGLRLRWLHKAITFHDDLS